MEEVEDFKNFCREAINADKEIHIGAIYTPQRDHFRGDVFKPPVILIAIRW
tara:strand:- start:519 stop:671 length:153 start_codon:yes stop_codon:yes gene_type:complete